MDWCQLTPKPFICVILFHKGLGAGFLLGKSEILHLKIEVLGLECGQDCTFPETQRQGCGRPFSAGRVLFSIVVVVEGAWRRATCVGSGTRGGRGGCQDSLEVRHSGLRPR